DGIDAADSIAFADRKIRERRFVDVEHRIDLAEEPVVFRVVDLRLAGDAGERQVYRDRLIELVIEEPPPGGQAPTRAKLIGDLAEHRLFGQSPLRELPVLQVAGRQGPAAELRVARREL